MPQKEEKKKKEAKERGNNLEKGFQNLL